VSTGFEYEPPPVSWVVLTVWLSAFVGSMLVWALAGYGLARAIKAIWTMLPWAA